MAVKRSLAELQDMAYKIATIAKPGKLTAQGLPTYVGDDEAKLFKYWKTHKSVGVPYSPEYEVDEGGYALICSSGTVLYWDGTANDVQEL